MMIEGRTSRVKAEINLFDIESFTINPNDTIIDTFDFNVL